MTSNSLLRSSITISKFSSSNETHLSPQGPALTLKKIFLNFFLFCLITSFKM